MSLKNSPLFTFAQQKPYNGFSITEYDVFSKAMNKDFLCRNFFSYNIIIK